MQLMTFSEGYVGQLWQGSDQFVDSFWAENLMGLILLRTAAMVSTIIS